MDDKYFIVTVDTEGDNLWAWKKGSKITTENSRNIPRFQELCEKYNILPVYLVNYEMSQDDSLVHYLKGKSEIGKCEIGMHIHAWNNPPMYDIPDIYGGNPYITEYPDEIIVKKIRNLKNILENRFGTKITSFRSGRWATNEQLFKVLKDEGINADCSVVPGMDLSSIPGCSQMCGNNYHSEPHQPYNISAGLMELPLTAYKVHYLSKTGNVRHDLRSLILGRFLLLRPIAKSKKELQVLTKKTHNYLHFMIHSSELMAGCNPYFKTTDDVERLYDTMEGFFSEIIDSGYSGITMKDYVQKHSPKNISE